MTFDPRALQRLHTDDYIWLTTVSTSGRPVPKLVWFYYDGDTIEVFTKSNVKLAHIAANPNVSLNFDSNGEGGDAVVVLGRAVADGIADPRTVEPYWNKYAEAAAHFGLSEEMANYDKRIRITIDKTLVT